MTAEENVALPMILEGRLSASEISARARELLERVGLGERLDHLPSQMSGGEQQRVTIARAIANRPAILLLDEPTGDLDTVNGTIILSLLLHLNRHESMTCIMVTHDTALKSYAHRVVHMVDGKVARLESIDEKLRQEMDDKLKLKVQQVRRTASKLVLSSHALIALGGLRSVLPRSLLGSLACLTLCRFAASGAAKFLPLRSRPLSFVRRRTTKASCEPMTMRTEGMDSSVDSGSTPTRPPPARPAPARAALRGRASHFSTHCSLKIVHTTAFATVRKIKA